MGSGGKRVHVFVSGRVQGVCYREMTRREATRNNVFGWVRNMPDGRVEAVFEGRPESVDQMVNWCRTGPDLALVEGVEALEQPYSGAFNDFRIRYRA